MDMKHINSFQKLSTDFTSAKVQNMWRFIHVLWAQVEVELHSSVALQHCGGHCVCLYYYLQVSSVFVSSVFAGYFSWTVKSLVTV